MINDKLVVGSEEWVKLPKLNIPAIKVRVDSGAKTSSLHAVNIHPFIKEGEHWVRFDVYPLQGNGRTLIHCEAEIIDKRIVKSSSGTRENRYVIKTFLYFGEHSWEIELTLTNRDSMGYRMLLGREAMIGRILVDPESSFLHGDLDEFKQKEVYREKHQEKQGLKIGLLASNPDLYSNKRIIEAGERLGHEVMFFNIRHCYMKLDAKNPEIHYRGGKILNDLDAVIPRIRPSMTFMVVRSQDNLRR